MDPKNETLLQNLREASRQQRQLTRDLKNQALLKLAQDFQEASAEILAANKKDLEKLLPETSGGTARSRRRSD
jgi:gamma-glutamyl phosphate reductase